MNGCSVKLEYGSGRVDVLFSSTSRLSTERGMQHSLVQDKQNFMFAVRCVQDGEGTLVFKGWAKMPGSAALARSLVDLGRVRVTAEVAYRRVRYPLRMMPAMLLPESWWVLHQHVHAASSLLCVLMWHHMTQLACDAQRATNGQECRPSFSPLQCHILLNDELEGEPIASAAEAVSQPGLLLPMHASPSKGRDKADVVRFDVAMGRTKLAALKPLQVSICTKRLRAAC